MSVEDVWFQWVNQYFNPTRKFVLGHLTLQKPTIKSTNHFFPPKINLNAIPFFFFFFEELFQSTNCQFDHKNNNHGKEKSPNLVRMGCKTHILHHPIKYCYISILLKI